MRAALWALVATLALASCGDGQDNAPVASRDPDQRYRVSTMVLENASHGPQLCLGGVRESLPPQCGGPDVEGLDWSEVANKESLNGTTWAQMSLTGTYDGTTFTLTERPGAPDTPVNETLDFSPLCDPEGDNSVDHTHSFRDPDDPDVVAVWVTSEERIFNVVVRPGAAQRVKRAIRETYPGLLCVVERDRPSRGSLREIEQRVHQDRDDAPLGGVFSVVTEERRGVVVVSCAIADDESKQWAAEHWGDLVELRGLLRPLESDSSQSE